MCAIKLNRVVENVAKWLDPSCQHLVSGPLSKMGRWASNGSGSLPMFRGRHWVQTHVNSKQHITQFFPQYSNFQGTQIKQTGFGGINISLIVWFQKASILTNSNTDLKSQFFYISRGMVKSQKKLHGGGGGGKISSGTALWARFSIFGNFQNMLRPCGGYRYCSFPESIHTPSTEANIEILWGWGSERMLFFF